MLIKEADIIALAVKPSQYPPEDMPEIAFAGRSNVGKSSLLNLITGRKKLAKVSGQPGKTRTINFFDVKASDPAGKKTDGGKEGPGGGEISFRIVDLPGYGYAKVSKSVTGDWGKMMETFLESRKSLRAVVQLVDSRHEPTAQDVQMYEYLRYYGLSGIVVATKSDKCKKSELRKNLDAIRKKLDLTDEDIIIPVSALKREGKDRLLEIMGAVIEDQGAENG